MKKKLMLFLMLMLFPIGVHADHMYNVDMDIYVEEDGTAKVTEVWDVKADSGSEWYKAMYNLGTEEVSNFKVSMDGTPLTYKEDWNVNGTLSQKKGYYGINFVSEGIELCFGKGDMSRHKFTLTYDLSNFVTNVGDAQAIYQTLLPNVTLDNFTVTISGYYEFPDTLDVWGFGGQFLAYVKDGKIELNSDGYSLNNAYVVLLAKFPEGTFITENRNGNFNSFDEVLSLAKKDTFDYDWGDDVPKQSFWDKVFAFISMIFSFIFPVLIIAIVGIAAARSGYGYKGNKTINKKEVPMFRDIPCNKDIYYANALINLNSFGYKETNIFGAILLKWLRQPEFIDEIEKQAFAYQKFNTLDDAKEDVISKIYFIVDKLNELEEMIDRIDEKNTNYVSATTEKMQALLTNDKSIKAKMSKIVTKIADTVNTEERDEILNHICDNLYLSQTAYLSESSLFLRSYTAPILSSEPLELDDGNYDHIDDIASGFIENMNNTYSHKNVMDYVENHILNNKNELDSSQLKIESDEQLILTIHSMLKGWDKNIFYKIELNEGNAHTSGYTIPSMTYVRRRKL